MQNKKVTFLKNGFTCNLEISNNEISIKIKKKDKKANNKLFAGVLAEANKIIKKYQ